VCGWCLLYGASPGLWSTNQCTAQLKVAISTHTHTHTHTRTHHQSRRALACELRLYHLLRRLYTTINLRVIHELCEYSAAESREPGAQFVSLKRSEECPVWRLLLAPGPEASWVPGFEPPCVCSLPVCTHTCARKHALVHVRIILLSNTMQRFESRCCTCMFNTNRESATHTLM